MVDLNSLRVFATVASLRSFSAAARVLGMPKSSVSRAIARLEADLGTRLFQRTTREVVLTDPGIVLRDRAIDLLGRVDEAVDYVGSLGAAPQGVLRVSAGIGFGLNVLSELLPMFRERYPAVTITLELTSRAVDLVAEGIDVAIRMGPMPDSRLMTRRLGMIRRYPCAAPSYLARRGEPRSPAELGGHDTVEMPGAGGRARVWSFTAAGGTTARIELQPAISVNDALTIHRLVLNGAGIGCLSGYLCGPDVAAGRLMRLFPGWIAAPVEVNVVFPSNRELSPAVRSFVDFLRDASAPGLSWQDDPLDSETAPAD